MPYELTERLAAAIRDLRGGIEIRLEDLHLAYRPGWPVEQDYTACLSAQREADRERGFTRHGPHRADLQLRIRDRLVNDRLSRGQQKLVSLLLLLGQHTLLTAESGTHPLLLLDDPVSELDAAHLTSLLEWVAGLPGQTWITAVDPPAAPASGAALFHVEQGGLKDRRVV